MLLNAFECSGNPLKGTQRSLKNPGDDGVAYSSSSKLLDFVKVASSLESVILCGLSDARASTTWSWFLTRHLYDPRLFLLIWAFVN